MSIDVDSVRQMYVQPHKAPWDGEEGKRQQAFGVKNACLLATSFAKEGVDVVVLDVVTNETIRLYKENLPEAKIILLMPTLDEARRRFKARPHTITDEEFEMVYRWEEALVEYDEKIDNTNLSAEETAKRIDSL